MPEFHDQLARAQAGDSAAMAEIVAAYESEIRMIARLRLGPALRPYLDSIDLVQSVHHSVMAGLKNGQFQFERPEDLVALAATIVRRKAARQWQRLQRQQRESGVRGESDNLPALLQNLTNREGAPDGELQYRELMEHVNNRMDGLEKRMMELHLEGYSTAAIARMLNQNPDVLRVKLSRLRSRLRSSGLFADGDV